MVSRMYADIFLPAKRPTNHASIAIFMEARKRGIRWAPMALPTFHTIGVWMQIIAPLTSGQPIALYPPQSPAPPVVPNADNVLEYSKLMGCTGIPAVPSFVEVCERSCAIISPLTCNSLYTVLVADACRRRISRYLGHPRVYCPSY